MTPIHPQLRLVLALSGALANAAETGARRAQAAWRRRRRAAAAGHGRRPGRDSPMWNALAGELRAALQPRGAKARLARYVGVPKQRLHDFLRARTRLPDAELTLRLLHWLAEARAGRDPTL